MLWTREITDMVVSSTNNYGVKLTSQIRPHKKHCRAAEFKKVDAEEIYTFLAICLLSGSVKFSVIRDMFSYNPLYYHPIISRTMSGRRFEQILRCFSVEYNDPDKVNSTKYDPIKKIEPIFKKLINNFQLAYIPYECLSLDESLLLHRGRLLFRQYMRLKKARYGIKFFELCTSDGFVLNMEMYKGKREEIQVGSTSKINSLVFRILEAFLDKGHTVFMDNYYNSISLSKELLHRKTHTTGTLRSNRKGNPKCVTTKKLKSGDYIWRRQGKIYVSKWKDKRDVLAITTKYQPQLLSSKNRFGNEKKKPNEIIQYNKNMSGIDRSDQMVKYYSSPRKQSRWYKKVLFHLLDITVWNSFYIYKKHFGCDSMTFNEFRDILIKNMINLPIDLTANQIFNAPKPKDPKNKRPMPEEGQHYQEKIPLPPLYKRKHYFKNCKIFQKL